jgi:inactivated superfamily I helicase
MRTVAEAKRKTRAKKTSETSGAPASGTHRIAKRAASLEPAVAPLERDDELAAYAEIVEEDLRVLHTAYLELRGEHADLWTHPAAEELEQRIAALYETIAYMRPRIGRTS